VTDIATKHPVSHTGQVLSRPVTFKFALDPTQAQAQQFFAFAGTARLTFNHHLGRVKENLTLRAHEKERGLDRADMTPSLPWSKFSLINEVNAWKNGELEYSPLNEDGLRGLSWRGEVSTDVFETASVDAAQALANWSNSKKGSRQGPRVGFPRFRAKHRTTPSFRLRNRAPEGTTQSIRVTGPKTLRLPKIGEVRVHGCTKRPRRMIESGRLRLYYATLTYRQGRWWVTLTGVATQFHHEVRSPKGRRQSTVGVDLGLDYLAVAVDVHGTTVQTVEGVKILRSYQDALRAANQNRLHAKIANQRRHLTHHVSRELVLACTTLVREDLHVAGMVRNHSLALSISDANWGELIRQIDYKAQWYGTTVVVADRWFASTKTCSACGAVREFMTLAERTFVCTSCGFSAPRDTHAAVNLARWPSRAQPPSLEAA
jgi:putative transposase